MPIKTRGQYVTKFYDVELLKNLGRHGCIKMLPYVQLSIYVFKTLIYASILCIPGILFKALLMSAIYVLTSKTDLQIFEMISFQILLIYCGTTLLLLQMIYTVFEPKISGISLENEIINRLPSFIVNFMRSSEEFLCPAICWGGRPCVEDNCYHKQLCRNGFQRTICYWNLVCFLMFPIRPTL